MIVSLFLLVPLVLIAVTVAIILVVMGRRGWIVFAIIGAAVVWAVLMAIYALWAVSI